MAKFLALGALIKATRIAHGMDQATLAGALGVGQQAVSGWERGASRPRLGQLASLCEVLDLDMDAVQAAGGYGVATSEVRPLMLSLPFESLADDAFEAFCRDLFQFERPGASVSRNGASGEKQYGIDVFIEEGSERVGVQCKRHKVFGAAQINAVVQDVLPQAKITSGIIALSRRTATARARVAMSAHAGWTLLDGEDLSSRVRGLPRDRALRLVDTYFPGYRGKFLGISEPSPWRTAEEHDGSLAGRMGIDRNFELAGRSAEVERLLELTDQHPELILVVGRGGIGKSRLLQEYAGLDLGRPVVFATPGPIAPESYELLPEGAPIVIVDDATDSDFALPSLIGGIRRTRPDATIVLAARPKTIPEVATKLGIAQAYLPDLSVEIGDLSVAEAEGLARDALSGNASEHRVEALARVGYDCPFLIVVGAHLIRNGKLSDSELLSESALRSEILRTFAHLVTTGGDGNVRADVLGSLAALQPVKLDEPEFLEPIAAISGHRLDQVLAVVEDLENLGVVLRRGTTVRVVPDLLGDAILERALVSQMGIDTGFAARIADSASGRALVNAIRNVSIIDWRRRSSGTSGLAEILWKSLTEHAVSLPNSQRIALGRVVSPVAAVYAAESLGLVEAMLKNPAPDETDPLSGVFDDPRVISTDDVINGLGKLVSNAARDPEEMERAMALLLRAGLRDKRPENQYPSHPLRLMRELGEYHPARPVSFNARFAQCVGELLDQSNDPRVQRILLTMLKPLLAHDFTVTESKGLTLSLSRHSVNFDAVADVREMAIKIAEANIDSAYEVSSMAIDVLHDALSSSNRNDPVTPEFERVTAILERILSDSDRPGALRLSAYRALGWHAIYGEGERRVLARRARARLVKDDEYTIARAVRFGWDAHEDVDEDGELDGQEGAGNAVARYHRAAETAYTELQALSDRWAARGELKELLTLVREVLRSEVKIRDAVSPPESLLTMIFVSDTELALFSAGGVVTEDRLNSAIMRIALSVLIAEDVSGVEEIAARLIAESSSGAQIVASALANTRTALDGLRGHLVRLAMRSDSPDVYVILLSSIRWMDGTNPALLLELLEAAPIESDPNVTKAASDLLAYSHELPWAGLGSEDRKKMLARFGASPKLDADSMGQVLNQEIELDPLSALRFLQNRVDANMDGEDFDPLPHMESMALDFSKCANLKALADDVIDWILDDESWSRRFYGQQILEQMLGPNGEVAQHIIRGLVESQVEPKLSMARQLLTAAPHDYVIRERVFVLDMLEVAQRLPESLSKYVLSGLHGSAEFGMRSRAVGVDDPREITLMEEAAAIAETCSAGSPGQEFYREVATRARRRLAEERADDRSLEEQRKW